MKIKFKSNYFAVLAASLLLFSACDSDNDPIPEPDLSMVHADGELNQAFEDLDFMTLSVLQSSGVGARTVGTANDDLCSTAIITTDAQAKKIIVDFGAGCTSSNGVERKGKILLAYTGNLLFPGATVITTFEGYEVNGLKLEGIRTLVNTAINLATSTITLGMKIQEGKVTWPDNKFVTFISDQVRSIQLGAQSYEIKVTGTASGINREGLEYSSLTTTPLVITQTCVQSGVYIPTTGILQFSNEGMQISIDYGSGTCDKIVTLTYPGGVKEVILD